MNIDLTATTTRRIQEALTQARHQMGGPAVGMVLTLVIVTDESAQYDSLRAATEAAREHPCRVLTVISRDARGSSSRLDAEIRIGETGPGETVLLRMYGPLAQHADSVVVPLLVPDAPVVTWWPGQAPAHPSEDPLGALAQRRVTDAYAGMDRLGTLIQLDQSYTPGDTDFSWTRLTPWRTLLASALDQETPPILSAEVQAEPDSPSAELLAAWLGGRLNVPASRTMSTGPGITAVVLQTGEGPISVTRPDGRVATISRPGQPDRQVALHRRPMSELLAEELRRLDPDEIYHDAVSRFDRQYTSVPPEASPEDPPNGTRSRTQRKKAGS
ncbi:glucose-6-phosphate dehydrogenase assembly protein OpcA [Actinocorallia sp. A-T 12471]|uniref:glucose-6-phosphate dehydrogenase assembly protein OpcA n=1 Tax=Actinocorallia sp. A-T 12471 TaxID=3089813 RepID=UPI0029D0B22D|nr:glucose-6-phosphate dehydrogenase assembly protein OpcA [Actinocorallia sp. A-T 12471]MDX6740565.1 glucose-6-phosphate dehydrogenase assembly protein OpcA [Actinocorallia sp. A-T 12471]